MTEEELRLQDTRLRHGLLYRDRIAAVETTLAEMKSDFYSSFTDVREVVHEETKNTLTVGFRVVIQGCHDELREAVTGVLQDYLDRLRKEYAEL